MSETEFLIAFPIVFALLALIYIGGEFRLGGSIYRAGQNLAPNPSRWRLAGWRHEERKTKRFNP